MAAEKEAGQQSVDVQPEFKKMETVIEFHSEENIATVYTSNPAMMKKFDRLCSKPGSRWELIDVVEYKYSGDLAGKGYICPIELIKFKAKE